MVPNQFGASLSINGHAMLKQFIVIALRLLGAQGIP
jgi:hypothetical protein